MEKASGREAKGSVVADIGVTQRVAPKAMLSTDADTKPRRGKESEDENARCVTVDVNPMLKNCTSNAQQQKRDAIFDAIAKRNVASQQKAGGKGDGKRSNPNAADAPASPSKLDHARIFAFKQGKEVRA
jgi:hypothetical protein